METEWLENHCFKRIENWNRSKYNIFYFGILILRNTTFWNYILPHMIDWKSPLYKAKNYKFCHSHLQENSTLQAWKCHYFPLILPTGSLPFVPRTSSSLVGALELITLHLRLPEAPNTGERYQIPLFILYKQLRGKPQLFGSILIVYVQANAHSVNLPGYVHNLCLQWTWYTSEDIKHKKQI